MRSRGSTRNRVRPVAVEPGQGPVSPSAEPGSATDIPVSADPASHDTTSIKPDMAATPEKDFKPMARQKSRLTHFRSKGGRIDKTESTSKQLSLRKRISLFRKNLSSKTSKSSKTEISKACSPIKNSQKSKSTLNSSQTAGNTTLPTTQNTDNAAIAGTGGALGLTPVMQMFKMQSITTKPKLNQDSTGKKRKAKESSKGQGKKQAKRRILAPLNQPETPSTRKSSRTVIQAAPIKPTYTFVKRRSEISSDPAERRTSLGSIKYGVKLPRELSSGTMNQTLSDIDMSLETSIMNKFYPDGKSFYTDFSESILSDSMYSTDTDQDESLLQQRRRTGALQRSNSMRLMRRNASNMLPASPRLSQTINLGNEHHSQDASITEQPNQHRRKSPRLNANSLLDDSYIKAQLESLVQTPVEGMGITKREVRRYKACSVRSTRRVSPVEKACMKKEGDNFATPRGTGLTMRRSRSLRMWGKEQGDVVTGHAGRTPKPRRRRPSYDERLIM